MDSAQEELRRKLEAFKRRKEIEKQRSKVQKQREVAGGKGALPLSNPQTLPFSTSAKDVQDAAVGHKPATAPQKLLPRPILRKSVSAVPAIAYKPAIKISNNLAPAPAPVPKPMKAGANVAQKTNFKRASPPAAMTKGSAVAKAAEKEAFPVNIVGAGASKQNEATHNFGTSCKATKVNVGMVTDPVHFISQSCQMTPQPFHFMGEMMEFFEYCKKKITTEADKMILIKCVQSFNSIIIDSEKPLGSQSSARSGRLSYGLGPAERQISSAHSTPILQPGSYNPINRAQFTPADDEEEEEKDYDIKQDIMDEEDAPEMMPPTSQFLEDDRCLPYGMQRPSGDGDDDEDSVDDGLQQEEDNLEDESLRNYDSDPKDIDYDEGEEEEDAITAFPPRRFGKLKGTPHPTRKAHDVQGIVRMLDEMNIGASSRASAPIKEDFECASPSISSHVAVRKNGRIEVICGPVEESGSVTVLTPRKANRLEREFLGVDSVVTKARRSVRLFKQDAFAKPLDDDSAIEEPQKHSAKKVLQEMPIYQNGFLSSMEPFEREKVAQLMEQVGHSFAPNKDLLKEKEEPAASIFKGSTRKSLGFSGIPSASTTPRAGRQKSLIDNERTPKANGSAQMK